MEGQRGICVGSQTELFDVARDRGAVGDALMLPALSLLPESG
jgi:hypothetical protein